MAALALRGATLIDATGRDPVANSTVVVEDGGLASVGSTRQRLTRTAETHEEVFV